VETLCVLYGVNCIKRQSAAHMASGALKPQHDGELRSRLLALCAKLNNGRGDAILGLCDGFNIPDHCLQAPIAFDWRAI
jgi:acyl-CoA oxidase